MEDWQIGFRPPNSTINNTIIIRQIFENCYEHNIFLHNILVDYTQAFDSIHRNKITEYLIQYKIPEKLIRLVELTLINTRATDTITNEHTDQFKVTRSKTRKFSICNFISYSCRSNIKKPTVFKRKYIYMFISALPMLMTY